MRICYFGTYRAEYARNQIMIAGLRNAGIEVVECHEGLWQGIEDRVQTASGGWMRWAFFRRVFRVYLNLLKRYSKVGKYDILVVGYPGHFDVYLARWLSWLRGKPLVWDVLNSLYLITLERGLHRRSPLTARLLRWMEKLACRLPNRLILDTELFVTWFQQTHGADPARFRLVQIGADERIFQPAGDQAGDAHGFKVIYYGSYIPNHGVQTIVEAAQLLAGDPEITFEMVGEGPEKAAAVELARQLQLPNLTFTGWLEHAELSQRIACSDLVLGVFGTTRQVALTNNNKIYEGFAMRKPVISTRTPALPAILKHQVHLYLCEPGNPPSLADGIRELKADPGGRKRLAQQGYQIFREHFDVAHIGAAFAAHLEELAPRES